MSVHLHSSTIAAEAYRPPQGLDSPQRLQPAPAEPPTITAEPYRPEPSWHPQLAGLPGVMGVGGGNGVSFDAQVRGQDAQAIDLELMQIADAVYDPNVESVGNWSRVSDADLSNAGIDPSLLENPDTGFRAGIYSDGDGNYVLAYAGSNEAQDWTGANLRQGLGWQSEQYDQAVQLAQFADEAYGDDLVITGHSLGGGLAATASFATGNTAVTFNASGVHDNTIENLGLDVDAAKADAEGGQIRRYNVDGDPLTTLQEDTWGLNHAMPDAPGHEITLDNPYPPLEGPEFTWNPVEYAKRVAEHGQDKLERAGELHSQQGVLDALEQQQPWEG
ncbi:MAG: hypothetical protein ACTHZI_09000 [Luteimonas sp.]